MQQLTSRDPAQKSGSAEKETLIIGKVQVQPQQRVSASELAVQPGMEFPSNSLPVVMDEEEDPVAFHAEDLVSTGSYSTEAKTNKLISLAKLTDDKGVLIKTAAGGASTQFLTLGECPAIYQSRPGAIPRRRSKKKMLVMQNNNGSFYAGAA